MTPEGEHYGHIVERGKVLQNHRLRLSPGLVSDRLVGDEDAWKNEALVARERIRGQADSRHGCSHYQDEEVDENAPPAPSIEAPASGDRPWSAGGRGQGAVIRKFDVSRMGLQRQRGLLPRRPEAKSLPFIRAAATVHGPAVSSVRAGDARSYWFRPARASRATPSKGNDVDGHSFLFRKGDVLLPKCT